MLSPNRSSTYDFTCDVTVTRIAITRIDKKINTTSTTYLYRYVCAQFSCFHVLAFSSHRVIARKKMGAKICPPPTAGGWRRRPSGHRVQLNAFELSPRPDTVFRHLRSDRGVGATPPPLAFPNEASQSLAERTKRFILPAEYLRLVVLFLVLGQYLTLLWQVIC